MYQKLIEGCREGKRLAQNELYKTFYSKMLGVCLRYAKDREEAVEMLNGGYFKVFNTIKNFDFGRRSGRCAVGLCCEAAEYSIHLHR